MDTSLDKSLSETDLNQFGVTETPPNFVSSRYKRRGESYTSELSGLKDEMRSMMLSLFKAQKQEMEKISLTLQEIKETNISIENSIKYLTSQNEEFKNKIEHLEGQIKEDRQYLCILEDKLEDLQMWSRKSNFEIKNVPKKENETKEDLITMVMCLTKNIGCEINRTQVKDIYRVRGKKVNVYNTPIIVETTSTLIKNDILKMCKSFNIKHKNKLCAKHLGFRTAEDTPIFVSEQLTAKGSRLHFLARDLVKSKNFKYCWTAYGKVYVRKDDSSPIILVKSEAQAHQLLLNA